MADEVVDPVVVAPGDTPNDPVVDPKAAVKPAGDVLDPSKAIPESPAKKDSLLNKAGDPDKLKDGVVPDGKVVPEKYEIKLPEGATLDQKLFSELEPVLKGEKVSAEGANKLAELHLKGIEQAVSQLQQKITADAIAQDEKWEKELMTELGSKAQEELSFAAKARDMFFSKETREFFDTHHIGSNPHFLKDLVKIGKKISESKIVEGGPQQGGGFDAKTIFPSMNK